MYQSSRKMSTTKFNRCPVSILASASTYHSLIHTNLISYVCLILLSFLTKKAGSNCNNYNLYSWDGQSKYRLRWLYRLWISIGFLSSVKKILVQNKIRMPIVNFGHKMSSASNPLMTPMYYSLKIQRDPTVTVMDVYADSFSTCYVQTQKTAGINYEHRKVIWYNITDIRKWNPHI